MHLVVCKINQRGDKINVMLHDHDVVQKECDFMTDCPRELNLFNLL